MIQEAAQQVVHYTDPVFITTAVTGVCAVIAAIAAAAVKILNALKENTNQITKTNTKVDSVETKVDDAAAKVVVNDQKTDAIAQKADEIHKLANGNLTVLQTKLDIANAAILQLTKEKAEQAEKMNEVLFEKFKVDRRVTPRRK